MGISILGSALCKVVSHAVKDSCRSRLKRHGTFGYPLQVLMEFIGSLLRTVKGVRNSRPNIHKKHLVLNNMKEVASRYEVPMVFSAVRRLATIYI